MTPRERVMAHLNNEPVDRIPNFTILMGFLPRYIGKPLSEFLLDHRVLVESNLLVCEEFGIDLLNTMSDPYREADDFGSEVSYPYDSLPLIKYLLKTPADIKNVKPFKFADSVRMMDRAKAVELYKREAGDKYPIMGFVEGCAAESADLLGLTNYIYAFYEEPEMVREIMDKCLESILDCIKPQVDAGADIIGVGDAVASVLGPNVYREWVLPYEKIIFEEIRRCGAVGRLHICGNIAPLLDDIKTCGARIVDVDWMVDLKEASDKLAGSAVVCGNFNPVSIVMSGNPEMVAEAVRKCVADGGPHCFIMPGCEVPHGTPYENLMAIHKALVDIGGTQGDGSLVFRQ